MTKVRPYSFHPELRVWVTPCHDSIAYSDGEHVEPRLLDILKQCRDLSSTSDELRRHITDWPSEYHFSPQRHAVLRPFSIAPSDSVLELGCGCGAITRYLGETGATVVAVEGSLLRAQITAERCRDLPNVAIYCDNLANFKADHQFNVVTLIGVLEYAPMYVEDPDPIAVYLKFARSLLAPNGHLIVAIENQLGLKYFNGCGEDHVGKLFFGIQDQYSVATPITFGRTELEKALQATGFPVTRFLFPFPDYKLPDLLLTEQALHMPELGVHNVLAKSRERDYAGRRLKVFDEHLAWRTLGRNGLISELANSFLVVAGSEQAAGALLPAEPWLAEIYATTRKAALTTATTIYLANSGLRVSKRLLGSTGTSEIALGALTLEHRVPTDDPFIGGDLLLHQFQRLAAEGNLNALAEPVRNWLDLLFHGGAPTSGALEGHLVSGELVDCIPANLIVADGGQLVMIDKEWQIRESIPVAWIVLRGLINTLHQCTFPYGFGRRRCETVIVELLALLGYSLRPATFVEIGALETALQEACGSGKASSSDFHDALTALLPCLAPLERATEIDGMVSAYKEGIAAYEGSLSWRITRPLRYVARILLGGK